MRVRFDTKERDRCFEGPYATAGDGVVVVGSQVRPAEGQGVRHGGGIVVGGAPEVEGDRGPVVLYQRIDQLERASPDPLGPLRRRCGWRAWSRKRSLPSPELAFADVQA